MKEKNIQPQKDPQWAANLSRWYFHHISLPELSSYFYFYYFRFKVSLHTCLLQITGYRSLYTNVEDLRKQIFSSEKTEHEDMLLKVSTQGWL